MVNFFKFSNFDVYAIVRELDSIATNAIISNIYEIENFLIIKLKTKSNKTQNLIIKDDSRINITHYNYPIPKFPSQYIMSLRKFMKNRKILSISQYDFDRVIIFHLSNYGKEPWKFVIELFNKGNYILIDEKNLVKIANNYTKFKDRRILPNKEYDFPKSRGKNFLNLNQDDFDNLILKSDEEVVRIMARNINISGLYSEEICHRAGIEKTKKGIDIDKKSLKSLFISFKNLRNQLLFGEIKANIIIDKDNNQLSVQPFELTLYNNYEKKYFSFFNEAVDYFYSQIDSDIVKNSKDNQFKQQLTSQKQILKRQQEYLTELKEKKNKYYEFGNFIYANFNKLQRLLTTILNAKKKGYSIEEINDRLINAKKENQANLEYFIKINPSTNHLVIEIQNHEVKLNLNYSLGENANRLYTKGKKFERKMVGTIDAIEKTKLNIKKLKKRQNRKNKR